MACYFRRGFYLNRTSCDDGKFLKNDYSSADQPDGTLGDLLFLGRRADGRCRRAGTATDFAQGSDSDKEYTDPTYNNPFLNANIAAAESRAMDYFQACVGGGSTSAATGSVAGPGGAAFGGITGCGPNILERVSLDAGAPKDVVRYVKLIVDIIGYTYDAYKGIKNLPDIIEEMR